MAAADSSTVPVALSRARALLKPPMQRDNLAAVAASAFFFALMGLALAATVVTTPASAVARTR